MARVSNETLAAIEAAQQRLQTAQHQVRQILARQEERLEQSRRILEWARRQPG